ncbi:MAG TPA: phage tail protein, partial [Bacteroidia bacterium]|nr:phage tail protein [Bacteroidia bacterium]
SSTGTFVSTFGFAAASGSNVSLNTASLSVTTPAVTNQDTGTGAPFSIVPSYLGMHYIICTNGVYPLPPQSQDKP